jgi:hypothetical protein
MIGIRQDKCGTDTPILQILSNQALPYKKYVNIGSSIFKFSDAVKLCSLY